MPLSALMNMDCNMDEYDEPRLCSIRSIEVVAGVVFLVKPHGTVATSEPCLNRGRHSPLAMHVRRSLQHNSCERGRLRRPCEL